MRVRGSLLDLGSEQFSRWKSHLHVRGSELGQIRGTEVTLRRCTDPGSRLPTLYVRDPGTPGRPSLRSVCWVQALPDPAWRGFQGSFLPLSAPQSPPGHIPMPLTTTSRDHPGHSQRTCPLTSPGRAASKMRLAEEL